MRDSVRRTVTRLAKEMLSRPSSSTMIGVLVPIESSSTEFAAALMAALPQCPLFKQLYACDSGLGEADRAKLEAVRPDDHPAGELSVFV